MTKEEKDKLIKLSDLNREDNIKYISSEAQGIAITLDSDRFAPSICKLERAYICGRRKSENRISELEKENAELRAGVEKRDSDILTLKGLTERQRLKLDALEGQTPWKDIKDKSELIGKLTKAKEIIRNIIRVTWGEGWNYSLEWKVKAEQFLKEVEK